MPTSDVPRQVDSMPLCASPANMSGNPLQENPLEKGLIVDLFSSKVRGSRPDYRIPRDCSQLGRLEGFRKVQPYSPG